MAILARSSHYPGCARRYQSAWIYRDTGCDRVCDVLLGNHAQDVFWPRHSTTAYDERHHRSLAPKSSNDIEHNVVLADQRKIAICNFTHGKRGVSGLGCLAWCRVDPYNSQDVMISRHHNVAHSTLIIRQGRKRLEYAGVDDNRMWRQPTTRFGLNVSTVGHPRKPRQINDLHLDSVLSFNRFLRSKRQCESLITLRIFHGVARCPAILSLQRLRRPTIGVAAVGNRGLHKSPCGRPAKKKDALSRSACEEGGGHGVLEGSVAVSFT
jgi:hypothetical protein